MTKRRKPKIGDRIEVHEPVFNRVKTGVVVELREDEFDFRVICSNENGKLIYPDNYIHWCRYTQNWKVV